MNEYIKTLLEIKEDGCLPKNIKNKIEETISVLENGNEIKTIKANKALQILEEVSEEPNLPAHIRTQIWNLASLLEKVN